MPLTGVLFARQATERYLKFIYDVTPGASFELDLEVESYVSYPGGWKAYLVAKMRHGDEMIVIKHDEQTKKASLHRYGLYERTHKDIGGFLDGVAV